MPYVNIKITKEGNVTAEQKRQLIEGATNLLRDVLGKNTKSLVVTNAPSVKLLERGAPYPKFEIDRTYSPTDVLSVKMRTGDLGEAPHLWDEKSSFLGRTYPSAELKCHPSVDWWKRTIEPKAKWRRLMRRRASATRAR